MPTTEKQHSKYRHVYAVVRIDFPVDADQPENSFSVVKVFASKESAERDTERLSLINAGKRCSYHTYVSRMPAIQ
jgi:hypothetical protein